MLQMRRMIPAMLALAAAGSLASTAWAAPVRYRLDDTQTRVVALSNLADASDCLPDTLTGKVAARSFDATGLVVQSVVIAMADGERTLVNVDAARLGTLDRATRGWVMQGLQTLLNTGRTVDLKLQRCGAAGRVLVLDAIISSRP